MEQAAFLFGKIGLSLVYKSVSSVQFFPLLKNRENDMGLGKKCNQIMISETSKWNY